MRIGNQTLFSALAVLPFVLGGCGIIETGQKMLEIVLDPEVQVGDDGDQPSTAMVTFFSQRNANLNAFAEAVPVSVFVLQLRGDVGLNEADIIAFMDDAEGAIGKDYVDSAEYSIPPGEFLSLDPLELDAETSHLGFAALFADVDGATWQAIEAVEAVGKGYTITVEVSAKNLRVALEEN